MKTIYAGDGIEFKARFFSGNVKALVIPGKAEWRLECDTTGTLLQDWTEATLVTDVVEGVINEAYAQIDVDGSLNALCGDGKQETKRLLVSADRGTARQASEEFSYNVRMLAKR
jgi:hypothetical protein